MDRSIAFALLSMTFAGVTAVLAKAGMRNVSGDGALLVRTCLIFGLVWGNAFAFRQLKELALLTTRDVLFLGLSGATTFFSWLFYYRAMKEGSVSVVATIDKASNVVTLVLSFLVLREPYLARGLGRHPHPVRVGGTGVEVGGVGAHTQAAGPVTRRWFRYLGAPNTGQ